MSRLRLTELVHSTPQEPIPEVSKPLPLAEDAVLGKKEWHQALEAAVEEAHNTGKSLAVLFMDVNGFKDVNDTLGHDAGDEVIAELREVLSRSFRTTDSTERTAKEHDRLSVSEASGLEDLNFNAGHIGGDEFAIFGQAGEKGAQIIADRVRAVFANYFKTSDRPGLAKLDISLAIGVAVLEPGMSSRDLLIAADHAMYNDKLAQVDPLTPEQIELLLDFQQKFEAQNMRIRDMGKYLLLLSRMDKD